MHLPASAEPRTPSAPAGQHLPGRGRHLVPEPPCPGKGAPVSTRRLFRDPPIVAPLPAPQASIHANTYVVSGASQTKKMSEQVRSGVSLALARLPAASPDSMCRGRRAKPLQVNDFSKLMSQLGPEAIPYLKAAAQRMGKGDDIPDVASFDQAA